MFLGKILMEIELKGVFASYTSQDGSLLFETTILGDFLENKKNHFVWDIEHSGSSPDASKPINLLWSSFSFLKPFRRLFFFPSFSVVLLWSHITSCHPRIHPPMHLSLLMYSESCFFFFFRQVLISVLFQLFLNDSILSHCFLRWKGAYFKEEACRVRKETR